MESTTVQKLNVKVKLSRESKALSGVEVGGLSLSSNWQHGRLVPQSRKQDGQTDVNSSIYKLSPRT